MKVKNVILMVFVVFVICSCKEKEEPQKDTHEFLQQMAGDYLLFEAIIDQPLDLNFDGIANTDLYEEITKTLGTTDLYNADAKVRWSYVYFSDDVIVSIMFDKFDSHYDYGHDQLLYPGWYGFDSWTCYL